MVSQPFPLKPESRNGLSLAPGECPLPDHHPKVNVPDLLLRLRTQPAADPFGPGLRSSAGFTRPGSFYAHDPLPAPRSALPLAIRTELRSGTLIPRPRRSARFPFGKLASTKRPVSVAPRRPQAFYVSRPTDHRFGRIGRRPWGAGSKRYGSPSRCGLKRARGRVGAKALTTVRG